MNVRLHALATTTPKVRRYIQQQPASRSHASIARELGVDATTVKRWRRRSDVTDRSHTAKRLQTRLTPLQEWLVVELRKTLWLTLDDLLVVTREYINANVSRSGLDRCLRRHGVNRLADLMPETEPKASPKRFKDYEPGYLHIDIKYLPQMPDETERRYLFVAIDRATRWVHLEIRNSKSSGDATAFLNNVATRCPVRPRIILTDNDKAFTDRLLGKAARSATGKHPFDRLAEAHGIEHRLIRPGHPATNGMVERFNGRIAEILRRHRFTQARELEQTIGRYAWLYNHHINQKALGHQPPIGAMKEWYRERPDLFQKKPVNLPGPDK